VSIGADNSNANDRSFSLRSFISSILFQSPATVKEKLDILYDLTDSSNKYVDGIDMHDVVMIYDTILRQHLYYLPFNELRTQVERVFNKGNVAGIVGAFWTRARKAEIKLDMPRTEKSGFHSLEAFLKTGASFDHKQSPTQFAIVDVTQEVQVTFAMY